MEVMQTVALRIVKFKMVGTVKEDLKPLQINASKYVVTA